MRVKILVKEIRKAQGKTLSELYRRSGVSITQINDIENNLKRPSLYVIIRLAKGLGVPITLLYKIKW